MKIQIKTPKKRKQFDRTIAMMVAREIVDEIQEACEKILVCGSLRRQKLKVRDIEIVFVPQMGDRVVDLLTSEPFSKVDEVLDRLLALRVIAKRRNVNSSEMWGPKNKLGLHVKTGIPIDFFATTEDCWHNYVVVRTGGAKNNQLIAQAYQKRRCKWNAYGRGFTNVLGEEFSNNSEADVYENAGLKYLHPYERL